MRSRCARILLLLGLVVVVSAPPAWGVICILAWDPVTTLTDGSPATDLARYHVYKSTTSHQYGAPIATVEIASLPDPAQPRWEGDCAVGDYFVVTAVRANGIESAFSNEVHVPDGRPPDAPMVLRLIFQEMTVVITSPAPPPPPASEAGQPVSPRGEVCEALSSVSSATDNRVLWSFATSATITSVWCFFEGGSPVVLPHFQLKHGDPVGTLLTHTPPLCASRTTMAIPQAVTGNNAVGAQELLLVDTINTPDPTTMRYLLCVGYTRQ